MKSHFKKILVRGANWVGDTVMTIPALKQIRRIFPDSHIEVWAPSGLEPLIKATNLVDGFIGFSPNGEAKIMRPFRTAQRIQSDKFDSVILFQNAFESALTTWLASIPERIGYSTDLRGALLTVKVPQPKNIRSKHEVFYYLEIADYLERTLFRVPSGIVEPDCSISLTSDVVLQSEELLRGAGIDPQGIFFCLCPGSVNSEAKRWPPDYFTDLTLMLNDLGPVVFLGAPNEKDLIDSIIGNAAGKAANLAGIADPITSMAIMGLAKLVISNDTGSAHLAVAAKGKVLTIFGPTKPGATAPYGPNAHIIQGKAACAPCRKFRCPEPDHKCMRSILPAEVFSRVLQITDS